MNINTVQTTQMQTTKPEQPAVSTQNSDKAFSDELKSLSETKANDSEKEDKGVVKEKTEEALKQTDETSVENEQTETADVLKEEDTQSAIGGLEDTVEEMLNRTEEKRAEKLKLKEFSDEIKDKQEVTGLIDNNMNIQEPKDRFTPEMNANMSFNSNGQPFSEFINPSSEKQILANSAKDIAEEKEILSTMEENIAIANKNMAMKEKTVTNEEGVKKINTDTNITIDTIVKFDSVVMDKNDVEFFANLVNGEVLNMSEIQNPEKSASVSKTLADLLAKSMENNKPVRIDFDNNISVIIKISRDGKISADFLPSSQVAEAYLKENLPLLRQRFDDNNIEYEQLNQRKQNQNQNDDNNRKKGRKDE